MSYSSADVMPQIADISKTIEQVLGTSIAQVSNKKLIARCNDELCARELAFNLRSDGYSTDVAKGLKTDYYYVAAYYNSPY